MKNTVLKLSSIAFFLGLLCGYPNIAISSDISARIIFPDSELVFDDAAGEVASGTIIGEGWQIYSGTVCQSNLNNPKEQGKFTEMRFYDARYATGLTVNFGGKAFPVYAGNVKGVGYAWGIREDGDPEWYPIKDRYGSGPFSLEKPDTEVRIEIAFARVRVDGIPPKGDTKISRDARAFFTCYKDDDPQYTYDGFIDSSYTHLKSTASTCNINTKRLNIDLGEHDLNRVNRFDVGYRFGLAEESIEMSCNAEMRVYMTLGEYGRASKIGSDFIELTDNSDSPGYGVQVFHNGSPALKVGGDKNVVTDNHQLLFRTEAGKKNYTVPLRFEYVKTAKKVKASSGNAALTLTFAYD
ncbi:fimbrial protein [Providencia stuartii]|uniref:fimbrial protein n=1 Tax=Providencia stuartii TaxID=588 RepID=UPI00370C1DD7